MLIDAGYLMLGSINLEHILGEVGVANIVEIVRSYQRWVVVEDVA